ncbi:MAG: polysaccharide deacetylase family protein [Clostridia bacterium]|nr:polysaccharide deacetylase family protein [Clostridia bacterium]
MKRIWALLFLLLLLPLPGQAEKAASFPAAFQVKYTVKDKLNTQTYLSWEYVTTAQPNVDEEINRLVDEYVAQMGPEMKKASNPKRNSRLDVHVVNTRSGQSLVSFLVLARESYNRKQQQSPFTCRVYDMDSGEPVSLTDLFDEDSEAWEIMEEMVYEELDHYFPQQEADEETLRALCTREALQNTPFMLGPVSLSFHYEAKTLYPKQPTLMRVTIPYNAIRGFMTEYGERQTDNSNYKMVALTFDDGPDYANSATLLNNLRHAGAQATFFLVGDRIDEYADIAMRENDENHSLQSHHYKHTDTSKSTIPRIQAYTEKMYEVMTKTWGLGPWMLRAPYGIFDYFIKAKINLPFIEWDVDTKDWTGKSTSGVMSVVRDETKDGSIILMHDIKDNTPESGRQAAEWLFDNGFMCVTVEELFIQYQQDMTPNKVFYSVNTAQDD